MKTKKTKNGVEIPVIGLGTWLIGGGEAADRTRDREAVDALREAFDMGYRHIDTAEIYGDGHSEELIGKALDGYDRNEFFITSKVSASHLSARDVGKALDGSLSRLGVEYLDLYLIHWPNERYPLRETITAMNDAVRAGKVRHLGVSNFVLDTLREAVSLSEAPIVTDQVPYSIGRKDYAVNGVLRFCREEGMLLTAYSPIRNLDAANPELKRIAAAHGVTSSQIAIAWLVNQDGVITIPKSTNPDHLRANLKAAEIELSKEEMETLGSLF